jgi:subtilisin family serine protease
MKCFAAGILIALALAGSPPAQTGLSKLGPGLIRIFQRPDSSSAEITLMTVWKHASDVPADAGPCLGRVCVLRTRASALSDLTARQELVVARMPLVFRPRMNLAGPQAGLNQARNESGLTGNGVLIAVIDTGVDWTHPDFIDGQGRTRVAWLLDQTQPARGEFLDLEAVGGGAVYSAEELQGVLDSGAGPALGAAKDVIGHGTHVAGIAAGSDAVYTGAAPRSRLIVVKAINDDLSGFGEERVLEALAFADRVARREHQPLVVNLSLGTQIGAHDGSDALELALSELAAGQGRVVTVAAGNDFDLDLHARAAVADFAHPAVFRLNIPASGNPSAYKPESLTVDFWHSGSGRLEVVVVTPSGEAVGPVGSAGPYGLETVTADGGLNIDCLAEPDPVNGDLRTLVTIAGEAGQPLTPGAWRIVFSGKAERIDGWIGDSNMTNPWPRFLDHVDRTDLVGPPATALGVIAVGAFVSRTDWTDVTGNDWSVDAQEGELSWFSSPGPTRDGRLKPELAAPGLMIAAALSSDSDPRMPISTFYAAGTQRNVLGDGRHALAGGTSMAAPLAAGAAALILERDPTLSGTVVRDMLAVSTATDEHTGRVLFKDDWGFGKLDALNLVALGEAGRVPGKPDPEQSLCGVAQPWLMPLADAAIFAVAVPRDAQGLPLGPGRKVEIEALGAKIETPAQDLGNGIYLARLSGPGRRGADVKLVCRADGVTMQAGPRVRLAASYQELFGSGMTGGACNTAGGTSTTTPALLAFLLVWLWRRAGGRRFAHT